MFILHNCDKPNSIIVIACYHFETVSLNQTKLIPEMFLIARKDAELNKSNIPSIINMYWKLRASLNHWMLLNHWFYIIISFH